MIVAVLMIVLVAIVIPLALWVEQSQRLRALEARLARLEREAAQRGALLTIAAPAAAAPPPPAPIPIEAAAPAPTSPPATPPPAAAPVTAVPVEHPAPPAQWAEPRSLEQLVGGLWLQNAGSVLLLLGSFFLILWGYTTGRFGPWVLVAAGVALGLALAWRGDRAARRLPPFGHALIGVGLGVVYVTLYLGHFTLQALDARAAFALLALTSLGTVAAGLHYRSEAVAALGVLGAFLPQLVATWTPTRGFDLAPPARLAYLAVVDAVVFVLAAGAGHSADEEGHPAAASQWAWGGTRLDLAALILTTLLWVIPHRSPLWGWGVQAGLSALYAGLGLAAVPRLARSSMRVPASALAVVALAPLGYLAVSWPFLAFVTPHASGLLLLAMALVWMLAARWVEPRRADEELWRPLVAAAVLFLTAALERALGTEQTPMAWCLEALALVWLGLRGHAWLRACGYVVGVLAAMWLFARLATDHGWSNDQLPLFYPDGLRNLIGLAALMGIAVLLGRARQRANGPGAVVSKLWTGGSNLLTLMWSALESTHVARALHGTGGRWAQPPSITDLTPAQQTVMLAAVLTSFAWLVQAVVLLALGWRQADAFLRWLGLGLFGFTVAKFLFFDLAMVDVFWRFLIAILVGAASLGVSYLYQRRARRREPAASPGPPGSAPPPDARADA